MKGKLFLGVSLLALTLASCNEDEQVAINQGRGISFRTAMNNSMTRAEDLTTGNLHQKGGFYVYGFDETGNKLIDNANFTSTDGTNWNESTGKTYFYPKEGEVNFFAYAPNLTSPTCSKDQFSVKFTPETTMANQKDFVFGTAIGSNATADAAVQLTLNHKLSKIQIKAKNTNPEYKYKVTGVKMYANKNMGTFTYTGTQGTWNTDGAIEGSYSVTYSTEKELTSVPQIIFEKDEDSFLLIPQQLTAWDPNNDANNNDKGAFISVKITITATTSDNEIVKDQWAAVPVSTNWQPGSKYIYTLDFSNGAGVVDPENPEPGNPGEPILGNPIKFTVIVDEWTDANENLDMNK